MNDTSTQKQRGNGDHFPVGFNENKIVFFPRRSASIGIGTGTGTGTGSCSDSDGGITRLLTD